MIFVSGPLSVSTFSFCACILKAFTSGRGLANEASDSCRTLWLGGLSSRWGVSKQEVGQRKGQRKLGWGGEGGGGWQGVVVMGGSDLKLPLSEATFICIPRI